MKTWQIQYLVDREGWKVLLAEDNTPFEFVAHSHAVSLCRMFLQRQTCRTVSSTGEYEEV